MSAQNSMDNSTSFYRSTLEDRAPSTVSTRTPVCLFQGLELKVLANAKHFVRATKIKQILNTMRFYDNRIQISLTERRGEL
jgi:hypothetical protein